MTTPKSELVGLQIDTEQRRALIYRRTVHSAFCFVYFINHTDKGDRFAVRLCKLSDSVSYISHCNKF